MACLETTFLIDLLRGKQNVASLKEELNATEATLVIAAPSIMELWSGACLSDMPAKEKEKIKALYESFEVLPLDARSAEESGEIEADLAKKGLPIETEDTMIAGIALSRGEKVVTRDEHYARIPGLKVLKY